MNTQTFSFFKLRKRRQGISFFHSLLIVLIFSGLLACQSEDTYFYEVNPLELPSSTTDKNKAKSLEQYISILYANLFQDAISADELSEIYKVMESIGDKELAREVIISNLMNREGIIIPTDEVMRADIDVFLIDTYKRFFVREPSQAEKTYMRSFINSNPDVTAELVYFSFAMSEEYQFY
ncbi:MAG: hypothetical protein AB8H47_19255 [Bacteroidia bacterium]